MAEIEYFYAAYSGYAYLGSKRLMEIANLSGHTIKHRPFDLRARMKVVTHSSKREHLSIK